MKEINGRIKQRRLLKLLHQSGWKNVREGGHLILKAPNGKTFSLPKSKEYNSDILKLKLKEIGYVFTDIIPIKTKEDSMSKEKMDVTKEEGRTFVRPESTKKLPIEPTPQEVAELIEKTSSMVCSLALYRLQRSMSKTKSGEVRDTIMYKIARFLYLYPDKVNSYSTRAKLAKAIAAEFKGTHQGIANNLAKMPWNIPYRFKPLSKPAGSTEGASTAHLVSEEASVEPLKVFRPLNRVNRAMTLLTVLDSIAPNVGKEVMMEYKMEELRSLLEELLADEIEEINRRLGGDEEKEKTI